MIEDMRVFFIDYSVYNNVSTIECDCIPVEDSGFNKDLPETNDENERELFTTTFTNLRY